MKGGTFVIGMQHFTYPVVLTPDKSDEGFVVTCRDLPEAITQGNSIAEAIEQAEGALQAAIESRIEDGMELPIPSRPRKGEHSVHVPVSTAMKAALYIAMRRERDRFISGDTIVKGFRAGQGPLQGIARRLFRPSLV
jgi:predicted RNase H-like HicB family nuclease